MGKISTSRENNRKKKIAKSIRGLVLNNGSIVDFVNDYNEWIHNAHKIGKYKDLGVISTSSVTKWITIAGNTVKPVDRRIYSLADYFGVDVDDIIRGKVKAAEPLAIKRETLRRIIEGRGRMLFVERMRKLIICNGGNAAFENAYNQWLRREHSEGRYVGLNEIYSSLVSSWTALNKDADKLSIPEVRRICSILDYFDVPIEYFTDANYYSNAQAKAEQKVLEVPELFEEAEEESAEQVAPEEAEEPEQEAEPETEPCAEDDDEELISVTREELRSMFSDDMIWLSRADLGKIIDDMFGFMGYQLRNTNGKDINEIIYNICDFAKYKIEDKSEEWKWMSDAAEVLRRAKIL